MCIGRSIGRTVADTVLMVIEKNMAGGYRTITCGYNFMNIEDQSDSLDIFLFDYVIIASGCQS